MKALIVDDHAAMRRLLGSCFPEGWDCTECADGAAAVRAYPALQPDCVLLDVEMPVMDGFTAAARLRELDPAAWIIFVSQHAGAGFREMAARLGARAFVPKQQLEQLAAALPAKAALQAISVPAAPFSTLP